MGLIPGLGRSPGEGNGNSPQYGNWKWQLLSLAWETPWTEAPSGLQSMGSQNRHNLVTEQQHDSGRDNVYSFASIIFSLRGFRSFHDSILSPLFLHLFHPTHTPSPPFAFPQDWEPVVAGKHCDRMRLPLDTRDLRYPCCSEHTGPLDITLWR